jgi:hypothetical protein
VAWLQIQRSGFDSQRYQIFWEVVGLGRGPLGLVSTIEKLLGRKTIGSGLECPEYCRGSPLSSPRNTPYPPTRGDRSVGIVPSRTKATEFLCNTFRISFPSSLRILTVLCEVYKLWRPFCIPEFIIKKNRDIGTTTQVYKYNCGNSCWHTYAEGKLPLPAL